MKFEVIGAALPLAGGAVIGTAGALYLATHGRIAGISGLLAGVLERADDRVTRASFLLGLIVGGGVLAFAFPTLFEGPGMSLHLVIVAGLLVGLGTRLGNGCTSGHGVCGMSRLSARSIIATLTFIATGAAIVALGHYLGAGR